VNKLEAWEENKMMNNDLCQEVDMPRSPKQESTRDRLERTKKALLSHLEDINRALSLLEKYPEMEELTDLLKRTC